MKYPNGLAPHELADAIVASMLSSCSMNAQAIAWVLVTKDVAEHDTINDE
jgi:hypothetical protein